MVSSPKPPDPYKTAAAQAGMNVDTAIAQQGLNMVDQYNPYGSVTYEQTGMGGFTNSSGQWVDLPEYSQTTTLSGDQQAILDQGEIASLNMATLAADQSAAVQRSLSEPFSYDTSDTEKWLYELGASGLNETAAQQEAALRSTLANQGIQPGSAAYNSEMARLAKQSSSAYNDLALKGHQQAYNEAFSEYNNPVNVISSLLYGGQVNNPATASSATPQTSVGGVDLMGAVNNAYNQKVAQSNAMMGGLFGTAGTLGGAAIRASDRRLKRDIVRIGTTPSGLPWYRYRYVWDAPGTVREGVMAQEVLAIIPAAVVRMANGFMAVDYAQVR